MVVCIRTTLEVALAVLDDSLQVLGGPPLDAVASLFSELTREVVGQPSLMENGEGAATSSRPLEHPPQHD